MSTRIFVFTFVMMLLLASCDNEASSYSLEQQKRETTVELLEAPKDTIVVYLDETADSRVTTMYVFDENGVKDVYIQHTNTNNLDALPVGVLFLLMGLMFVAGIFMGSPIIS